MKKTANYVPKPLLPLREGAAPGGETSVCHNLRPAGMALKAVGIPEEIHSTGLTPVFTDVMEGETYLFAQEDDGALYVSLSGGKEAARFLGRVEQKVKEGAAAGRFVVFLLADGGCVYVARTSEGYRWMGSLPALPGFGVSVEKGRTLTEKIEAVKFPEPLTELTSPAPQGITERAIGAWTDAWKRLCARLRGEGRWIEPVNVRLALRLWDGTLFRVSEPVRVAPPQREGGERVTLTVVADAKGKASGTAEGTLSASGYTIRLSLSGSVPDAWSEVVTGVEVWVSREPESLSGNHNNAAFGHDNQQAYLTFSPPVKGASDIDAEVAEMPYGMLTLLEPATTGIQAYGRCGCGLPLGLRRVSARRLAGRTLYLYARQPFRAEEPHCRYGRTCALLKAPALRRRCLHTSVYLCEYGPWYRGALSRQGGQSHQFKACGPGAAEPPGAVGHYAGRGVCAYSGIFPPRWCFRI